MCDVRNGPLVLHVPDTKDRYYVLQFVDAWTNNFAYIGRRVTRNSRGTLSARSPRLQRCCAGRDAGGSRPTGVFVIVGRIAVNGEGDLPKAHALQDQFTLTALSVYRGGAAPELAAGVPQADSRVGPDLKWWEEFRVALAAFPPPAADAPFLAICEKFGLTSAESPYIALDPALAGILVAGQKAAEEKLEELIKAAAKPVNGWQNTLRVFDYNDDYFEVGTLKDPQWRIPNRKIAYVTRAIVARAGLWGNHGYEANYQIVYVDADNQLLSGENRYELRLPAPPPVDAFWSLTMYDAHESISSPIRLTATRSATVHPDSSMAPTAR